MTAVLVIDDHPVVLQGCRHFLEDAGVDQVLTSPSFSKGFGLYRRHAPDLLIVDLAVHSGVLGGLTFVQRLRTHDKKTPIIVFSMHSDPMIVSRALALGANGYLLKDTWHEEFLAAFDEVRRGGHYISHELASEIAFMGVNGGVSNPLQRLSLRELHVLELVSEGLTYRAIADKMGISLKTVANTAAQIKLKLEVESISQASALANRHLPAASR